MSPLKIGNKVLIRCVDYYQVGEIVELTDLEIVLKDASWVGSTGRFAECIKSGKIPHVEAVREICSVSRSAYVDAWPWNHPLPTETL